MRSKLITLIIFVGLSIAGLAQEKFNKINSFCRDTSVHKGQVHRASSQNLQGIVVLKNGDTLSGCLQLIRNRCALPAANGIEYTFIRPKDITKVIIQIYSLNRKPVELHTLHYKHMRGVFWRLIETKGKFAVYDRSVGIFSDLSSTETGVNNASKNGFNDFMYIVSMDNHVEKIYGKLSTFSGLVLMDTDAKPKLLKYINRKYKKQFTTTDFKTDMEMVDYILTQENASSDKNEQRKLIPQ